MASHSDTVTGAVIWKISSSESHSPVEFVSLKITASNNFINPPPLSLSLSLSLSLPSLSLFPLSLSPSRLHLWFLSHMQLARRQSIGACCFWIVCFTRLPFHFQSISFITVSFDK
eukprot:sb/3476741/